LARTTTLPLNFYIDKSKDKARVDAFDSYALEKATYTWKNVLRRKTGLNVERFTFEHCHSHSNKCIQVADFVAGAAFHRYERGDPVYIDAITERISKETYLWP
jgi:hypothetical protein